MRDAGGAGGMSHRGQAPDLEELEPERLDLPEHAIQCGVVS
jgi:hypothetical protein